MVAGADRGNEPPRSVLVFERDPGSRLGLEKLLALEGWIVLAAASGDDALALVRERRPDVLVLDVGSHHAADVPAIAELRRIHADVPVLLTTADGAVSGDLVFVKPLDLGAFVAKLAELAQRMRGPGSR